MTVSREVIGKLSLHRLETRKIGNEDVLFYEIGDTSTKLVNEWRLVFAHIHSETEYTQASYELRVFFSVLLDKISVDRWFCPLEHDDLVLKMCIHIGVELVTLTIELGERCSIEHRSDEFIIESKKRLMLFIYLWHHSENLIAPLDRAESEGVVRMSYICGKCHDYWYQRIKFLFFYVGRQDKKIS